RLSLSMKDLTPSAWEGFVATHRPGDTVRGKVSRFTSFGVFVELGEGLEGLCHISELSDERVERPEDIAQLGQEMDFKILRIENDDQKIGLSHRAVGKEDEPIVDTRIYSSEAKGGMASLGELANLKFGGQPEEEPAPVENKEEAKKEKKAKARKEYEEAAAKEAAAPEQTEEPATDDTASEGDAPTDSSPESLTETTAENTETAAESTETAESSTEPESPAAESEAGDAVAEDVPAEPETPAASDEENTETEQKSA
ncbi:MAG TPA: S1 RNA-binding domain-containing protein, partial [Pyrinomonadaceae bacterium]|nr:S1 RNA-binding domain-containing protein [Pyrinomonadaceae bacterium]